MKSYSVNGEPKGVLQSPEWPFVTGFVRWDTQDRQLNISFLSDDVVRELGKHHHYVILNGPGVGQLQDPNDQRMVTLLQQIDQLKEGGASLHLEISGGANPQEHSIAPFAEALRGRIRSMGINDEELAQVASIPGYESAAISPSPAPGPPEVYQRYTNALRLAQILDLERLYVHGTDVDFVLRKGASEAALQQEVHADLFTKGAVVVSLLLRNGYDVRSVDIPKVLYHKGFRALIEFAWQLSLERYPPSSGQTTEGRQRLFERIVNDGHYLADGRNEYSVAVIPVMWPDTVNPGINTTGAGDICSGISLVYSGWR